ncbi:hypothetical protein FEM48_Zijuj07G0136700 [Ziziphus jujuba var. spinosa]|uniref:Uncharacterized protein n=1 Tax=Ziziphus jujuba var. spinosa TaxID=714518 RepID=A0A978V4Y8_ZIZJJ|nr:hypothetical protein FEM48_Zijuj07G0136700 [Ziziphus jujuba var. spinosa]
MCSARGLYLLIVAFWLLWLFMITGGCGSEVETGKILMNSFETTDVVLDDPMPVPKIPIGVSGTALAASLLRDGWSRNETNDVLARNMEYSQLIVDYQRKLKESSESLHAAQEVSRRLSVEVRYSYFM